MEKTTSKTTSWLFVGIIALAVVMSMPGKPRADSVSWIAGDGAWSSDDNWDSGVPLTGDSAYLGSEATVTFNYNYYSDAALGSLFVDNDATLSQSSNTLALSEWLVMGDSAGSSGYYQLTGGILSTPNEAVGNDGTGVFNQSGGFHYVGFNPDGTAMDDGNLHELLIGRFLGSDGWYTLGGTGVLNAAREIVGDAGGTGLFEQSGSSVHTVTNDLIVGQDTGAPGEYSGKFTLTGEGSLSAVREIIGDEGGVGVFEQTGGFNETSELVLGAQSESGGSGLGGDGTYYLYDGFLTVNGTTIVGDAGSGIFNQDGGSATTGALHLGHQTGATGEYNLSSGSLSVEEEVIGGKDWWGYLNYAGRGVFNQSGGEHVARGLWIADTEGSDGRYNLEDGNLTVNDWNVIGARGYAEFNQSGGIHTSIGEPLEIGGSATGEGHYNLSDDGILLAQAGEIIGNLGTGFFTQSGGTHTVGGGLTLGAIEESDGTYILNDGYLGVTDQVTIGSWGTGYFEQNGGIFTNTTNAMYLGDYHTGEGTYIMNDGVLDSGGIGIGEWGGTGLFCQYGGTVNVLKSVGIARQNESQGTYELHAGELNVTEYIEIGRDGIGSFIQDGGFNQVDGDIFVGTGAGSGTYNLEGGDISAHWIGVGNNQGTGVFNQTGGYLEARQDLVLGQGIGSVGTYNLSGEGVIYSWRDEYLGSGGTGTFKQDGGSNIVTWTLVVGWTDGPNDGTGSYTLNDGYVEATNVIIADRGTGTFDLKGGTLEVWNEIVNNDTFNYSGGTLNVTNTITNNGQFMGEGIINTGVFSNSGTLEPGSSPGFLTIDGSFDQTVSGILSIELGGYGQGINYDFLQINGQASLAGTLDVSLWDVFTPEVGNYFDILYATGGIEGEFGSYLLPGGWNWDVAYLDSDGITGLDTVQLTANAVPIPGAFWLLASAIIGLVGIRRKIIH